ncbi:MAG: hypothetical protein R3B93_06010 [Bacteroidia bacterium]
MMRSDKLGYNADYRDGEKKYYATKIRIIVSRIFSLSEQDLNMLTEAVAFMKQFQGFLISRNLDGMV